MGPATAVSSPAVVVYPPLTRESEFLDLYFKAVYYLPRGTVSRVLIPIAFEPSFDPGRPESCRRPEYDGDYPAGDRRDIQVRPAPECDLANALEGADVVLVWDWAAVERDDAGLAESPKLRNVDRHAHGADGWTWAGLLSEWHSERQRVAVQRRSQRRLAKYLDGLPDYGKAYVFGTGPSLETASEFDFSDGYRIVCNTIVNNPRLLDHIDPHFIVAGDAIYHFGTNLHACAFRRDLDREMARREMMFITRDDFYPLFTHHHPALAARTLVAATGRTGVHFDVRTWLVYHKWPHGNILNALMLPLGSALADEVFLLGFDGRAPGEKMFWQNSAANTYDALKPAIQEAHPGFFATTDFEAYARAHSDNAERIMVEGEKLGKRYRCLNRSYIEAFAKRHVAAGAS